jgi:DNA polymerase III sliding clamp (beta) subunit (PCNA family)
MDKETLVKNLSLISQILSEDYDILHFNPNSIHAESNVVGCLCKMETGITGSIRGIELAKLLNKIKDKDVEVKVTEKHISVKGGGASAQLRKYNKPNNPPNFDELTFAEVPEDFSTALTTCFPSISDKEIQGVLTGLFFGDKTVLACDNFTVSSYTMQTGFGSTFTIPRASAAIINQFKPRYAHIMKNKAIFANEDKSIFVWSVLMAGEYPSERILKLFNSTGTEIILPEDLANNVAITELFSYENADGSRCIKVDVQKEQVVLSGSRAFGSVEDTIKVKSETEGSFHIDPNILSRFLKITNKVEKCGNYLLFKSGKNVALACLADRAGE